MPDLSAIYGIVPVILPFECMEARFMQQAFIGLLLLAPVAAVMGIQVVNFRMAFFTDAISHSAFAGVAIGLIASLNPYLTMVGFAVLVGIAITALQRKSSLSMDTVVGVIFSAVVAFGIAIVSRDRSIARDMQLFLYGDILTISTADIVMLAVLALVILVFIGLGYNRMFYIGLNHSLARAHRIKVALYQYMYAALLSVVVIFSVRAVGVLLVTALLIVPAAAARNLSRTAGAMFWWSILISVTSAAAGLVISAQEWAYTATGATIILAAFIWFVISSFITYMRGES
ncbi:MAG TPA: metal ABC transporter permease [Desulfomonilia bacterium]